MRGGAMRHLAVMGLLAAGFVLAGRILGRHASDVVGLGTRE